MLFWPCGKTVLLSLFLPGRGQRPGSATEPQGPTRQNTTEQGRCSPSVSRLCNTNRKEWGARCRQRRPINELQKVRDTKQEWSHTPRDCKLAKNQPHICWRGEAHAEQAIVLTRSQYYAKPTLPMLSNNHLCLQPANKPSKVHPSLPSLAPLLRIKNERTKIKRVRNQMQNYDNSFTFFPRAWNSIFFFFYHLSKPTHALDWSLSIPVWPTKTKKTHLQTTPLKSSSLRIWTAAPFSSPSCLSLPSAATVEFVIVVL